MTEPADRVCVTLLREFVTATRGEPPLRVVAVTTMSSLVAALAARVSAAPDLAISTGFTTLDADPRPTLSLLESASGTDRSPRGAVGDTFVALARGWVGVVVGPAQLDGRARTNLSRVRGREGRVVALPGSRGLPENNHSPSRVWYLLPAHSARQLVAEVDFVSGVEPPPGAVRRLLTRLGLFVYDGGWRAEALYPDADPGAVAEAGFPIDVPAGLLVIEPPSPAELELLDRVDPHGIRHVEFGGEAGARAGEIIAAERAAWRRP